MDEQINHFKGDYYIQRRAFTNDDPKDSEFNPTPYSDYLLKQIVTRTTFGIPMEQPIHAASMNQKAKLIDHYGHEAMAGRPTAFTPIPVNGKKRKTEPLLMNLMNDRLALHQELTTGLCVREDSEIALLKGLYDAGYFGPPDTDDEEEYEGV